MSNILLVGSGGFATIQAAIDAAAAGDTVLIAAGIYHENLDVGAGKDGITIVGQSGAILEGTFRQDNGLAPDASVANFLKTAVAYNGNSGAGITVSADNVTIQGLTVQSFLHGIALGDGSDHLRIEDVVINNTVMGIFKGDNAAVSNLELINGEIRDSYHGMIISKGVPSGQDLNGLLIQGTEFTNLVEKGLYFETLSNALITGIAMENVGQYGRGPSFGGNGTFGAGIDINLKWDHEASSDTVENNAPYSGITIENFTFHNVGSSNKDGAAASHFGGAAIAVKARDDAPSYNSPESASFSGAVVIQNGSIDGTSVGIRAGEPNKAVGVDNVTGPAVNVSGVTISNASVADIDNSSQSVVAVTMDADDPVLTARDSDRSTGNIDVTGTAGTDNITTEKGNDSITGGDGSDVVDGGAGMDTAHYTGVVTATASGGTWSVNAGATNTDTLTNVEIVDDGAAGRILLVGSGGFATIQAAIDAAVAGDTVLIAAGTYHENVVIDATKDGLTIVGQSGAILEGTFRQINGLAPTDSVATFLKSAAAYTGTSPGITVSADNVTIQGLTVRSFLTGIELGNGTDGLRIENVTIDGTVSGVRKGTGAAVSNLELVGGVIQDSYIGMYIAKEDASGQDLNGLLIQGTTFTNLVQKGLYFESLSGAQITGIAMTNVGQWGRGPAFGGGGGFGNGIDINLKWDHEATGDTVNDAAPYSNIVIENFAFTNVGSSNQDGAAAPHFGGAAIAVKARDDAPSYSGPESASFSGAVIIQNGSINGTSVGIRAGEPNKAVGVDNVTGPAVNVSGVTINGASVADIDNSSQSVVTVAMHSGDTTLAAQDAARSTGNVDVTGTGGTDNITTAKGNDNITGGAGGDVIDGKAGTDTAHYAGVLSAGAITAIADVDPLTLGNQAGWQVNAGAAEGTDTLVNVEVVDDGAAAGRILLVGSGGYASIDAAISAAADGDTIMVAAGTWTLPLGDSGKQLTFLGANAGVSANDVNGNPNAARGPETIIDGGGTPANFRFSSGGGTFDGFTFTAQHFDTYVAGADVAFLNNVFTNPGQSVVYTLGGPDSVTLENNRISGVTPSGGSLDAVFIAGDWNGTTGTQVNISGNVFTGSPGVSGFNLSSVTGTIADNVIDGLAYYGFLLANDTDVDVTGNTFENITNPDPSVATWGAGIRTYTPGAVFGLNLDGNTFSNNAVGLGIRAGSDINPAAVTITDNVFTGNAAHIVNQGTTTTDLAPAGTNSFDSVLLSGATQAQLLALADKVVDAVDNASYGSVVLKAGHIYVTANSFLAPGTTTPSLQRAIDAAVDGDTILIAAGTYTEALTISGKAITLQAAGPGVIVQAPAGTNAITLMGNFETGDVSILGIDVRGVAAAPNQGIGVYVTDNANIGTLTLNNVTVQNAGSYGVFLDGEDMDPHPAAAEVIITNSSFSNNGYNGANGAAHIKLYGFSGDALIQSVTITGAPEGTPVVQRPDYGIELTGTPNSFLSGGTTASMGTVTLDNVTMTGWLHKNGLAFYNYADLDGLTVGGTGAAHDVDLSGLVTEWGPVLNIDGILDDVDASGFNVVLPAPTVSTELQGETAGQPATPQMITGTSANDRLMGKGGADHLKGGGGNDELYGHDKPGGSGVGDTSNDVLEGGTGNDQLYGGGGTDTAQYMGDLAGGSVTAIADADPLTAGAQAGWQVSAGAEGTDLLVSVEIVDDGAGGRILLAGSGGFATIQAAIDAAVAGDTVLIAAGTYIENVTLKSGVNVQGAGASESAVVIQGTLSTPATFSNATVSMLTVTSGSPTSMLLNMKGTSAITDVVFEHVTFSLTAGSFTGDVPIGNGQVSGSILLSDGADGDDAGLTFRHVTAASNDANFAASTAFVYTTVHGARMVLDDVTLTGTASGAANGLGAQWNMTPNTGETASVSIINSHTSGGGNFYVSGMDGVTITNNVFTGQGLALNGVTNATVTGNTFQSIDGTFTANGTQHRGLTIENAWGTDGVSDVTVTGNIFTNITSTDGAIAFQRWTDGVGNPVNASTALLNDIDIHGNTFTTVAQSLFFSGSSFSAATIAALAGQSQLVIGTVNADTILDQAGASAMIGGSGSDTFVYSPGGGATVVADFALGADKVDLTHIPGVFFLADVLSKASQAGADVVIDFGGGDVLTLSGVLKTSLAAADFVFAAIPVLTEQLLNDTGVSAIDKITSDPALTGTGDANTLVSFKIDGNAIVTTVMANASGAWSFTPTGLTDGAHTIEASQTNGLGNTGTISLTFTLDKTIATPTVALANDTGSSSSDKLTSDASVTTSAAAADVTRTFLVDGGVASGTYTAPTADGSHTVLVTDTDTAGNVATTSITFTLDKTIATPTVALTNDTGSSGSDKLTSDASLTVSAAAADVTRTFSVNGGAVSGTYAAPTANGSHTVVVTDTDTAGNVATASITFTLDRIIATPTVALVQDTGSSGSDGITSNASLAVSVAALDVARTFSVDGGAASGSYTAPTADGSHTVLVTDTDTAGNVATASLTFTLDKTIAAPTVALANDTGSSGSDGITSDASLTVSAAAADVTYVYVVDGGVASGTYAAPTADGSHTVLLVGTDTAGNVATASITFTLDKTIATPTVALVQDTGSSGSDGITSNAALTVSEAATGITRSYSVNGGPASGSYTAPTADGSHTVQVTDTDTAGNVATASFIFTLDKTIATPTVALANDTGSSGSDGITSDASLTVSAAAADVTRTYSVDGGPASGSYNAPTANGNHTVLVTDTDTAGNVATASVTFTLGGAIATPTAALANDTGSSGSDKISSDASLIVSEAAPDVTRTYTVDGGPASGTYAAPTADGSHTVLVTDTDTAGNVATASISFTLDKTIATPTVALANDTGSSGSDKLTSDASLAVSATAADVTRVFTVDGGVASATYTAPTSDGSHTVLVTDTDTAGNVATASITFTLDKTIATPTVALANDTGSSGSDKLTGDASLTVSAAAADVTRTYSVDGGVASGTYAAPTADGSHTVLVTDTDTAGNVATASITFTLDKTIATPTVALTKDTGSSGSDKLTSDASLAISEAAADVTRTYSVDGGLASATYAAPTADGSHTVVVTDTDTAGNVATASITFTLDKTIATPTVALTQDTGSSGSDKITSDSALTVSAAAADVTRTYIVDGGAASGTYAAPTADGSHTVLVTDTDTAGNVATASITFTLDKTIATPTVALAKDTGSSGSDKLTNDASLTVSAAAADVTRTYIVDGGAASGTYAAPTADGSHTVVVTDTDTAGNVATASITFTLDATAPGVAITSTGGATKQAAQTISGTANPGLADQTVHVLDGANEIASATVGGDGAWTVNVTLAGEGNHTITAEITDDAGNTGTSAGVTYALHTVVPVVTQALLHDAGTSATDKITNDATLKGTGSPDVVVTFTVDGVAIAGTALADGSGAWSFTPTGLGDGAHTIVATQTDGVGGTGSATLTFTLDTKAPDIAVTSTGGLTNKAAQTVSGTADAALSGQTVHVFDGASEVATATVGGDGSWTTTVTMAGQGAHTISAKVSDLAGNTGSSATILYTVDTIAPVVTQKLLNDTGTSPIDKITSDATVTGGGDANALVTFKIDGVAVAQTATADSSGAWSFTPLGLADGTHTIVASQTDGAGNVGSTTLTFTLDTTVPSAASISATSASQPEGNTGTTSFTFLVQLDHVQLTNQTMSWSVVGSGGNPAGASDFVGGVLPSGTITIVAGQTSAFVTVNVQGDKATEVNEQFTITLSNPSAGVTIATGTATSTIENDDNSLVDGYIAGATVFVDDNGNGQLDAGEASTTTDASGNFSLLKGSGPLVAFGGVDMATGLAFVGSLSAPIGSSVITPVTTLITALQASGITDLAEAQQVASKILGLDPGVDTLNVDPIAAAVAGDEAAAAAIVAGAKLLDTAQLIVSAVGDGGDKAAAFNTVFGAMAAAIGDLKSGEQYNLSDTATLTTLVNDVATAQGTDASAIADDLATIIAASNASLDQKLEENSSGLGLFTDISAVARVALGETANDLQAAAGDPTQIAEAVANHTGDSLTNAIAVAAIEVAPATVTVAVEPAAPAEGDSGTRTYTFTLTLDHESISAQTLVWSVAGVGANAATASDFAGGVLPGGIVTFAAGETSKTIVVSVTGDTTVEPDEAFALTLSEPSLGLIIGTPSTAATIENDDTSVAVVAIAATKAEGTGGTTAFTFTVTRSGDTSVAHSVSYGVTGSGANPASASDFAGGVLPSGVVSFAIGETTKTITIDVAGDASVEPDEGFVVTLSNPSTNLTIGAAAATAVIGNDDATVSIAALSAVGAEGNAGPTEFTFTVTRSGDISVSASVAYAVAGSGANPAAASDFVGGALPSGIVTFAVGETSKTVMVSIAGDVVVESDEGFTLSLSAPSTGLVLGTASATATVVNDDTSVSIAALLASKVEGNAGSTAFTFTVTRSGDTSGVSTVAYAVAGSGAAQADATDFVGGVLPSGVVTFAAGETTKTITVNVAGDGTVEPDNGFVVTLSTPSAGTTIGTASATGSVLNDDLRSYDDAYVVLQGHALTVSASAGVLANDDTSPPATATVQATTAHGQLQLAADGAVTYNPNAGFAGIDSFAYLAGSANGAADDAHALVYVVPVQVGPTATTLSLVALSAEEQIAATYVAFFGRGADAGGFAFWVDQFHDNQATQGPAALFANIASSFGISAEAKALYPFLVDPFHASDAQIGAFLDTVYDNLFNRAPDVGGLNYWLNQIKTTLAAGKFVGTVLVDIMSGAQNTGDGQDITTVMGKVAVGLEFVHQQQEHDMTWAGAADNAAAHALLDPVTSDAQSILTGLRNADTIVEHHG